ncbi:hypothetical protein [Candidatus Cyanaurora vandensis]|uniref:WD40/YVTN/BNR-like repeat-containing protein n=1 Tax=Candidatus Cyanaurora vandensis TaxID=2714958 RepID=UPI002580E65D|nr:hypothetical protein [Candidatus Cyanaurora vandensis]
MFAVLTSFLLVLAVMPGVLAQSESSFFAGLKARSIGPGNMSGRVAAVEGVVRDPDTFYVGTATGGVWKTTNGGTTWNPIFDRQTTSSVGAIALDQNNPETVWVGTGEANTRNSAGVGRGVFKSLDGGKTWQFLGLGKTGHISRLLLDPRNPNTAYVAALGTIWGENPERGVFKTMDGGKTWRQVLYVNGRTGAADLVMDPKNPQRLIAALWEYRRWPWFAKSGGAGSGLYVSNNGGEDWREITAKEGLPPGELGRIGLAIAPSNPSLVYALVEAQKNVLLRSEDSGATWKTVIQKTNINPRPFYFADIRVHPQNENLLYRLQVDLDVSSDGGKNFTTLAGLNRVHSDHHALWIHPTGDLMINGNDGGIALSRDRGKSWQFVDNLPLGQFYHLSVDQQFPYNIYGGLQDNGSWRGPSTSLKRDGIYNGDWEMVGFGDGFAVLSDPEDNEAGYAMSQGGNLFYFNHRLGTRQPLRPTETNVKHRYNWNAALALDPFDPKTIYYGSQFVHKSADKGQSWDVISPDLTTNDPAKQKQTESGGLTRDVTAAENHCTILSIAPSPVQRGVLWVGTDDGNIQLTTNGGKTWANVSRSLSGQVPAATWIPHVEASKFDPATAYVVFDDHRRANWQSYVFITRNYGKSWQSLATQDLDGFVHVIEQDPVDPELLFLGTEFGLYISRDGGKAWQRWSLPTVPVIDLVVHPREHDLVIGTHGRGIYILDDINPLRTLDRTVAQKPLHLFPVLTAYQYNYALFAGPYISPGDGLYRGTSRTYGALLTYVANPTTDQDKLDLQISDGTAVIRTLKVPLKKGLNRVAWDLRRKEFAQPTNPDDETRSEGDQPGILVLPGTYTATLKYGSTTVSQSFQVKDDPRLTVDPARRQETYDLTLKAGALQEAITQAFHQLNDTKKAIKTVEDFTQDLDPTQATTLKQNGAILEKKLTLLANKLVPERDRQGIYDRTAEASQQVSLLLNTLQGAGLTQAVQVKYTKVKTMVDAMLQEYNQLYQNDVPAYQKQVQAAGFTLFKKVPTLTTSD